MPDEVGAVVAMTLGEVGIRTTVHVSVSNKRRLQTSLDISHRGPNITWPSRQRYLDLASNYQDFRLC